MFISVDLPAPFSPSRQWISPGSTSRSMWSLATSAPKRLVIPRNSSFMRCASSQSGGKRPYRPKPRPETNPRARPQPATIGELYYFLKDDGEATAIDPSMMPALILVSSPARLGLTFDAKSWNEERPTPSFFSVPTYWVLSNVLLAAACSTTAVVAESTAFRIETRN